MCTLLKRPTREEINAKLAELSEKKLSRLHPQTFAKLQQMMGGNFPATDLERSNALKWVQIMSSTLDLNPEYVVEIDGHKPVLVVKGIGLESTVKSALQTSDRQVITKTPRIVAVYLVLGEDRVPLDNNEIEYLIR